MKWITTISAVAATITTKNIPNLLFPLRKSHTYTHRYNTSTISNVDIRHWHCTSKKKRVPMETLAVINVLNWSSLIMLMASAILLVCFSGRLFFILSSILFCRCIPAILFGRVVGFSVYLFSHIPSQFFAGPSIRGRFEHSTIRNSVPWLNSIWKRN